MFTVRGVPVEAVEVFRDHILVQEIESKSIYLIGFQDVDPVIESSIQESNIISLKGYKQWQEENVEARKTRFKKGRINKLPRQNSLRALQLVRAR